MSVTCKKQYATKTPNKVVHLKYVGCKTRNGLFIPYILNIEYSFAMAKKMERNVRSQFRTNNSRATS